jgi:hypothetical protein
LRSVLIQSDYSDSKLRIVQTDDGDIVLKVIGDGEFRIATNGGRLHGDDMVSVVTSFATILDTYKKKTEG